ncbi:LuxR family transcriptional regulator [Mycobacterium sp. IS-1590]|uniref:LuxR C-terminal-related transcriptional regulator n=1 Tax=Mycobacterium sp. IS-1590 TaxID=1772286 RepID=UPI00074801E0|nr:LuxR C-terminal-related transcriptional regulator [Mycobacterium sp. IS-1590]KUI33589.1 LuxR family transcriptional regulator [Mycobacterium sp. IS-1590]
MPPPDDEERSTSVVVVGNQRVVYAGIESWLRRSHPRTEIIGHFTSPAGFAAAYRTATPGLVVLFDLPCDSGGPDLDALRQICDAGHRVVVYTCSVNDDIVAATRDAGAVSCIAKHEPEHVLAAAIDAASNGHSRVATRSAPTLHSGRRKARPQLTHREQQVLIAWFQTENKNAVAERLYIEPSTVATHLQRVRAKYAAVGRPAPTKAALVARAIQDDILSVDDL